MDDASTSDLGRRVLLASANDLFTLGRNRRNRSGRAGVLEETSSKTEEIRMRLNYKGKHLFAFSDTHGMQN